MKLVNLLSMTSYCWVLVKLGFVKCLLNGEHYKRVEVRSSEKKFSKNKSIIFRINYATL